MLPESSPSRLSPPQSDPAVRTPSLLVRQFLLGASLILIVFAIFAPIALRPNDKGKGFLWTDDYELLLSNPAVQSPNGLGLIWTGQKAPHTPSPDFFPLTITSFWFEYRLFGDFAMGYHFVSALLHAGSAIFLWRILVRLRIPGAYLAAILFAITPVNVESVAWIAERKNTLSMFFMCASLLFYFRSQDMRRSLEYVAALVCFLLALLAKTAPVMLPFVLLLVAWWKHRRITKTDILRTAPFFAVSLVLGLITLHFQNTHAIADIAIRADSFPSRLATAGAAIWFYLGSLLFPCPIYFNYPRWNLLADYHVAAFLPLVALILLSVLLWLRRGTVLRHGLVALLIYILMLLPILGFINIFYMRYSLVSDHWQYHASVIPLTLLAAVLVTLARRPALRVPLITFIVVACLGMSCYSFAVANSYRNAENVWSDTLVHNPGSWLAHSQLGEIARQQAATDPNKITDAIYHLTRVVELRSDLAVGYINLGQALAAARRNADALAAFQAGLRAPVVTNEEKKTLHLNAGSIRAMAGDLAGAEAEFRAELQLDPDSPGGNFYLGRILLQRGDPASARGYLKRAVELGRPEAQRFLDQIRTTPATTSP